MSTIGGRGTAEAHASSPVARVLLVLLTLLTLTACLQPQKGPPQGQPTDGVSADGASAPGASTSSAPRARPNIVVFMLDDMRWDELNWMPQVRHFVTRRGVRFDNSFSPDPLCCPARASFLTGELTHNHRVYTHQRPFGFRALRDHSTLATALQSVGYRTALVGKYLNGYGTMWTHGGDQDSAHYIPPGWDDWYAGLELDRPLSDPLQGDIYNYFDTTTNENGTLVPHEGEYNTDVFDVLARRSLRDAADADDPFYLWVTPLAPHHGDPVEADDPGPRRLQPTEYSATDIPGDTLPVTYATPARPDWIRGQLSALVDKGLGVALRDGVEQTDGEEMADKPFYLRSWPPLDDRDLESIRAMTQQRAEALVAADVAFGRLMRTLRRTGHDDDTVVVVTSDNGFFLGEHHQREGKVKPQDPSLRVPLVIAGPGIPAGERRSDPASTVDLTATVLDYAGAPAPHAADGISLRSTLESGDQGWTRPIPYEGAIPRVAPWSGQRVLNSFGVRTAKWSYLRYGTGEAELYDLSRDPEQLRDLSGRPEVARIERRLDRVLQRLLACRGAACSAPLPRALWVSAQQERTWATLSQAAHRERYGEQQRLTRAGERSLLQSGVLTLDGGD